MKPPNPPSSDTVPTGMWGQLLRRLPRYGTGFLLILVYQAAQYVFDTRLIRAVDAAIQGQKQTALHWAEALIGLALGAFVVRVLSRVAVFNAGREAEYELRGALFDKLLKLGPSHVQQYGTGDLMSRATNDLTQVRLLLGFGVLNVFNTVLALSSALAVTLSISVKLTLASLVSLPALVWITRAFSRRMFARTRENQKALGTLSDTVQVSLTGVRLVRAFGLENNQNQIFARVNSVLLDKSLSLARLRGAMGPIMQAVSAVGLVVVFWYGGSLRMHGELSDGQLLAFFRAITRLTWPLIALGFLVSMVQRGRAAYERITEIFRARPTIESGPLTKPFDHVPTLNVTGLSHSYGERKVLDDVSFQVNPGERVAVVGRTGSGKLTLALLLSRALETHKGCVLLDDVDVCDLDLRVLRSTVRHCQQTAFLFSTSISRNLAYAFDEPESEDARLNARAVARQLRLDQDIEQLAEGYDTFVGERGIQLSGGQRQRVALGRTLLANSQILVLDDPTSSVDTATEQSLLQAIEQQQRGRSLIVITHRVSLASHCQKVLVLDEGRAIEWGSPETLLAENGLYATFVEEQRLEHEVEALEEQAVPSGHEFSLVPSPSEPSAAHSSPAPAANSTSPADDTYASRGFDWQLLKRLWPHLSQERRLLLAAMGVVLVVAILALIRPLVMRHAMDDGVLRRDSHLLFMGGLTVALLVVVEQVLGFTHVYGTQLAGARSMARLRESLFAFLHRLPMTFSIGNPSVA